MQMHAFPVSLDWHPLPLLPYFEAARVHHTNPLSSLFPATERVRNPIPTTTTTIPSISSSQALAAASSTHYPFKFKSSPNSSNVDSTTLFDEDEDEDGGDASDDDDPSGSSFSDTESRSIYSDRGGDGIEIEIEKIGKNRRRIRSKIAVEASLQTVWDILTDYERLADFIPGLAVSQLLEKRDNFARLFQIGQQNLAFGLKFNAKGIVDCYEKDLESLPFGQRRDIEFKMIEGDFQLFEGKWSIEQCNTVRYEKSDIFTSREFLTTLSYFVAVEPKLWLPVRLVEGRLCREIKVNLSCIQEEAQKAFHNTLPPH